MIIPKETEPAAAEAMQIATEYAEFALHVADATEAVALLGEVQKHRKLLDDKRKELKAPALESGKRIDAFFKPAIERLDLAKGALKQYIDDELRAQREAQRKALEEAKTTADVTVAMALPVVVAKTRSYRKVHVDVALLPRECMVPDMVEINARLDAGETIPGVTVTLEERVTA